MKVANHLLQDKYINLRNHPKKLNFFKKSTEFAPELEIIKESPKKEIKVESKLTKQGKSIYVGEWNEFRSEREGKGVLFLENGAIYQGNF
mmetsp:Transcript_18325/g.16203  ORF Transcript_18325/g.16203 Transcript_18325/m.16203 type:complete len:90 (-) Transcript_18325:488-757(-)